MFLLYNLYKANKKITEKQERLNLGLYTLQERTIKNYKKIDEKDLLKYNEYLIGIKKELEDKVKAILIAITISSTLTFNIIKFIQENFKVHNYIYNIAFILAGIISVYMLLAGILALYSISNINMVSVNLPNSYKRQIVSNIEFNTLLNIKRNNYMNTSYKCIYRALIIFLIFQVGTFIYVCL